MQISYTKILDFSQSLRLAVYDRQLELDGKKITYYFDTDFIYATLLGFRAKHGGRHSTDIRSQLARSLFYQGYLGKARLLSAHLYEIDLSLRTKDEFVGEIGSGDFIEAVKRHLEDVDALEDFKVFSAQLRSKDNSVITLLTEKKNIGEKAFIAIEQASGDWRQRLRAMGKNLDFSLPQSAAKELARHHDLAFFRRAITAVRNEGERKDGTVDHWKNTLRDAFALTELRKSIERFDEGTQTSLVRFYTETDALHRTWMSDREVRERLTYQSLGLDMEANFVVREAEYFLLRAYFSSLRMDGLAPSLESELEDRAEFAELNAICEHLPGLDETRTHEITRTLKIRGRALLEYIEELTSRTFLSRIWLQFKIPDALTRVITEIAAVDEALRSARVSPDFQKKLGNDIRRARNELSRSAQDFSAFFDLFTSLKLKRNRLLTALGPRREDVALSEPNRDLGLVRWGVSLSEKNSSRFSENITAILGADDDPDRSEDALLDLASSVRDVRGDFDQTVLLAAILWFLGDYDLASVLIDRNIEMSTGIDSGQRSGLELMSAASRLRGRGIQTVRAREILLERLEESMQTLGGDRDKFRVGRAYLYFHAAKGEEWVFGEREPYSQEREWAERSLEEVSPLLDASRDLDALLAAFALNHYVYVSLALKKSGETLDRRLALLRTLESPGSGVWNYRFVDTTSLPDFRKLEAVLFAAKESGRPDDIDDLYRNVRVAVMNEEERYERCGDFGDPEISVHLKKWRRLESDTLELKVARSLARATSRNVNAESGLLHRGGVSEPQ